LQICFVSFCSVLIRDNVQYCMHKIIDATEIRDLAQNGLTKNFILAEAASSENNRGYPFSYRIGVKEGWLAEWWWDGNIITCLICYVWIYSGRSFFCLVDQAVLFQPVGNAEVLSIRRYWKLSLHPWQCCCPRTQLHRTGIFGAM